MPDGVANQRDSSLDKTAATFMFVDRKLAVRFSGLGESRHSKAPRLVDCIYWIQSKFTCQLLHFPN